MQFVGNKNKWTNCFMVAITMLWRRHYIFSKVVMIFTNSAEYCWTAWNEVK